MSRAFYNIKGRMLLIAVLLLFVLCSPLALAGSDGNLDSSARGGKLTILFTNDGHSSGDYARLATLIDQERNKALSEGSALILVDAGDIAMGSVYQTIFTDHAFEYVAMGMMGYDAVTCGNHDFDFGLKAFGNMLETARVAADSMEIGLPEFIVSNLDSKLPPHFVELGISDTLMLRRSVVVGDKEEELLIGLYGLMGEHAYSCIVDNESLLFSDRVESSQRAVEALRKAGADYVVCISHGGTLRAKGRRVDVGSDGYEKRKSFTEDGKLAQSHTAPDVIISGHDHELLEEPLIYGNTVIGSAGSRNRYLGKMVFAGDSLVEYRVIPVSDELPPDLRMQRYIEGSYGHIVEKFSSRSGIMLDDTIAFSEKALPLDIDAEGNMELGLHVAESFREAVADSLSNGEKPVAIVPYGTLRNGISQGYITNHDVFDILSLGMDDEGTPGYPLILAWVTGKELYDICELNATVAGGMEDARLFFSGMVYRYNRCRIPFTRVTEVFVNGKAVDKKRLYPVVTGLYTARLMGMLESSSYGLLSVEPKDKDGNVVADLEQLVVYKKGPDGLLSTIPEWLSFAGYIKEKELKNPVEISSVDNSTPSVYLKYLLILAAVVTLPVLLLRSGRRAHGRRL